MAPEGTGFPVRAPNLRRLLPSMGRGLLCLAALGALSAGRTTAQSPLPDSAEITYIGNEGFFVSYAGRGVLIDALVRRGVPPYVRLTVEQREPLETAQPPFDRVQMVLVTHDDADHFDAGAVWRHLDHNQMTVFVSTSQAVARVLATPSTPDLEERAHAAVPAEGQRAKLAVEGIDLDVFNLHHGRREVQNVGFLVDIEGFRLFHMGDGEVTVDELLVHELYRDSVDVAFVPYWHLVSSYGPRMVRDAINPRRVVAMHIPAADAAPSYFGTSGSLTQLVARLEEAYPEIIIPEQPFERVKVAVAGR